MPRARVPSASRFASADALLLPWLAPRAYAESPVPSRPRRDGKTSAAQKELGLAVQPNADEALSCPPWQSRPSTARPGQPSPMTRTPARPRAAASLDLRYLDIASFAHRHARRYSTNPDSSSSTRITTDLSNGTRYSPRRSWKDEVARQVEHLDPQRAGRRRLKYIAQAEARLSSHAERLQRNRRNYTNKLLYDGQYRSLRRFILSLKRYYVTTEDVRKHTSMHAEDEHWLLTTFAALDRSTYARVNALTEPVTLDHDPRCRENTQQLLDGVDSDGGSRIWFNWHYSKERQELYESTLVYMLEHKPGYAQDFLTVLAADEQLPRSKLPLLADALAYLAKLHVKGHYPSDQGWEATPDANVRNFVTTFLICTRFVDTAVYSQDLLHSLVLLADVADLKKIYDALIESNTRLSLGTTLHFASAFGEAGEFRYALQSLGRRLAAFNDTDREPIVNSERVRWTCAAILRGSMREAKNYHETPGIVAAFVDFGVKMDLLLYDVVMHNAMEAGDFATAFKVFNALDSNGLKPDKYTFSILLHGCTTQNDPAMFKAFAEFCSKKAKELRDPWLATDFLYYTYVCEQNKPVASQDATLVWRAYLDLFDLTPLEPFSRFGSRAMKDAIDQSIFHRTASKSGVERKGVLDSGVERKGPLDSGMERKRLAPTPAALHFMLQTEIQAIQNLSVHYLERLYKTFQHAVSSNRAHAALTSLSQKPIIWNTFLYAFCKRGQYASASAVVKDMTAHGTAPNVYSWNIFMQSFFKTGQVAAAERVFELMRARGVDPDAYTHGVMVRGYAKAQLVDRIGETMQHISEDDQLDPDLLRALGQVQRRADLTASLERNRLAKVRKDAEDAERRAKEEEKRLDLPRFKSLFQQAVTFREPTHWDNGGVEDADDFMEPDEPATVESSAQDQRLEQSLDTSSSVEHIPSSTAVNVDADKRDVNANADDYLEPEDEPNRIQDNSTRTSALDPRQPTTVKDGDVDVDVRYEAFLSPDSSVAANPKNITSESSPRAERDLQRDAT